jgi:carbamoyltransferase
MKVLGLNLSHNASCAIVENAELIFSIEEERLSKNKKDDSIEFICENLKNQHFDIIAYTSYDLNINVNKIYKEKVNRILKKNNITFIELIEFPFHHLTHAFCSFYNSGFKEAICFVVDNGGVSLKKNEKNLGQEILSIIKINNTGSINDILKICRNYTNETINIDDVTFSVPTISLAGMYDLFKKKLNIKEAGGIMGYSCYGKDTPDIINPWEFNGKYFLSNSQFFYNVGNHLVTKEDICYKIQKQTTEIVLFYIDKIKKEFPNIPICLSGGLFQNCMINFEIIKKTKDVFVDPISHDGGTSIGLAQHVYKIKTGQDITPYKNLYLGKDYDLKNIKDFNNLFITDHQISIKKVTGTEVADLLVDNKSVAIFQGRSEIGPRALGNRSILFNPSNIHGKEIINLIKKREWFRPYAGTVLHEYKNEWFNFYNKESTEYMSYAVEVKKNKYPLIPAITHIDGTCRVQTLKKEENVHFYNLIKEFYNKTGIPILLNTSLNLANKPLVESIEDLIYFLYSSKIDYVYIPELEILLKNESK